MSSISGVASLMLKESMSSIPLTLPPSILFIALRNAAWSTSLRENRGGGSDLFLNHLLTLKGSLQWKIFSLLKGPMGPPDLAANIDFPENNSISCQ